MVQGAQQMSCGNCGGSDFQIYTSGEGAEMKLHVECKNAACKAVTDIGVEKPQIALTWGEGNDKGILCCLKRGNRR